MYTYICVYLHVMQVSNSNPDCRFEYIGRPLLRVCVCVCVLVRAYVIAIGVNPICVATRRSLEVSHHSLRLRTEAKKK